MKKTTNDTIDYFQKSIEIAKDSWILFKTLNQTNRENIYGIDVAKKNVEIINKYKVFKLIEHNAFFVAVVEILKIFEKNKKSLLISREDESMYQQFIKKNEIFINFLKKYRDENLAHVDSLRLLSLEISIKDFGNFFIEIENFFNKITKKHYGFETSFGDGKLIEIEVKNIFKILGNN